MRNLTGLTFKQKRVAVHDKDHNKSSRTDFPVFWVKVGALNDSGASILLVSWHNSGAERSGTQQSVIGSGSKLS